jgi:hypothetical protein
MTHLLITNLIAIIWADMTLAALRAVVIDLT